MTGLRFYSTVLATVAMLLGLVRADPRIVSPPQTIRVYSGQTAVLKCQLADLGTNKVSWTYVSKGFVIFEGNQRFTGDGTKYSIINVPEGVIYNLQILGVDKSDQGFYKCAIDGTNEQMTTHLDVLDFENYDLVTQGPLNVTDCCVNEGLQTSCLPTCYPSQIDLDTFDALGSCGSFKDLEGLTKCYTAGSNHDNCCLNKEVPSMCLDFCHNYIPDALSLQHLTICLNSTVINGMISCFQMGYASLPGEPTNVAAIASPGEILVKWSEPLKNPANVTGYKIMYKPSFETVYFSEIIKDPKIHQYRLTGVKGDKNEILPNMNYKVHVSALAHHGVSFGSVEIDVYIPDPSLQDNQTKDIDDCCVDHNVDVNCRNQLCRSKTLSTFNTEHMINCFSYLNSVFTCLVGERNHTNCCSALGVSNECLPMCSGHPPVFDQSLILCVSQLDVIESCVEEGYANLPRPPSQVTLWFVEPTSATFSFTPSPSPGLLHYVVEMRSALENAPFLVKLNLNIAQNTFQINDLIPNTYYWVRIVAETETAGSLPSETLVFLTYPDDYSDSTPAPVTNLPYNMTECCRDTGMPEVCWKGCEYRSNITLYYADVLDTCFDYIGSVLACASDGRDHRECCEEEHVQPFCLNLCVHTSKGPLDSDLIICIMDTEKAVKCFTEGIVDLPRHPDVYVSNVSMNSISLTWEQPKTSGRIDTYIIEYGISGTTKQNASTTKTSYILQNLQPGKSYEITVTSKNENGTSAPSPIITQYTLSDNINIPDYTSVNYTGQAGWKNISHCCQSSVSPGCLYQCLNKQLASISATSCSGEDHKMLACFADGHDQSLCCRERVLPEVCVPLCAGHSVDNELSLATCMSSAHRGIILSCFLENQGLVPGPPTNFLVRRTGETGVELTWNASINCNNDCTYTIQYWSERELEKKDLVNVTSPYIIIVPVADTYTFLVMARNSHGSGHPSALQTIFLSTYDRQVSLHFEGNLPWVDQGATALLTCTHTGFDPSIPIKIEWFYNTRRKLNNDGATTLRIENVDPAKHEGDYTCTVSDSALFSSSTLFLPVKYTPKIHHIRDDTVSPGQGLQTELECLFYGLPDSSADAWLKDGKSIPPDRSKYNIGLSTNYIIGITTYTLTIINVIGSDYDTYSITVSNKFGSIECNILLANPDEIEKVIPPQKVPDPVGCCISKGFSSFCQKLCDFNLNGSAVFSDMTYISCLVHFESLIECAADGRDHSKCCKNKGVLPYCIPMCSGVVPGDVIANQQELLQCVAEADTIIDCFESGQVHVPYAPDNVHLTLKDGKNLLVTWSKPLYSLEKVEYYIIYYNFTGHPNPFNVSVNDLVTDYNIQSVLPGTTYYVWMRSGNINGTSLPTKIESLIVDKVNRAPYNLKAEPIINSLDIELTWDTYNNQAYSNYTVHYKEKTASVYTDISNIISKVCRLEGLNPDTEYAAYVTANNGEETEDLSSLVIFFTTGPASHDTNSQQTDSGGTNKAAMGVGIAIAIIAISAIIAIIVCIVHRRRVYQPRMNDSVSFENPGFGSPSQVKFPGVDDQYNYGRLHEERPTQVLDEAHPGESTTDPAYENPMYETQHGQNSSNTATLQVGSN